jgi:hypothetical protein
MIAALAFLRALPWRYILAAAALAAAVLGLYHAGERASDTRWTAKEHARVLAQDAADAAQLRADAAVHQRRIKEDNQFTAKALSAQAQLTTQFATLQGVRRATQNQFRLDADRVQLAADGCGPAAAVAGLPLVAPSGQAAVPAPGSPPATPDGARAADSGPVLSLGAVWLWNAALSGQGADLGACRIDAATGQASAACAASSGLALDAAWDNHSTNAESCAADRLRHQQLIDFLNQLENGATK